MFSDQSCGFWGYLVHGFRSALDFVCHLSLLLAGIGKDRANDSWAIWAIKSRTGLNILKKIDYFSENYEIYGIQTEHFEEN